ncbi:MAG: beta-glucosidase [Verrucomicrobia bacterium]|nr:beta-glucosidase [Verrucomicrobiota bacterium]
MSNSSLFIWGAATASYQIEGAVTEAGRTQSIWDTFSHTPGKIERAETGDIACDHYHRYKEDVQLLRNLGANGYRFSISWSRVIPSGRGKLSQQGFDFYERLIDELLQNEIQPFVTLFHWDLPQPLQDIGGFTNRDIAGWFTDYAVITANKLADRVRYWIMLNEPSVFAWAGHAEGFHAPGVKDLKAFWATTHHLNLAQGAAIRALRNVDSHLLLGTTLNLQRSLPADDSEESAEMSARHDDFWNGSFLGPLLSGSYPERIEQEIAPFLKPEDLDLTKQAIDFLGINHYQRSYIEADSSRILGLRNVSPPKNVRRTSFDWEINPNEFRDTLLWVHSNYQCPPIYITENGAYFEDQVEDDGQIHDKARIDFLDSYVHAMLEARSKGVDIRGYFVWSLIDNFEWAAGYRPRFGIVRVDFDSLKRTPKDSYHWYREFIEKNRHLS